MSTDARSQPSLQVSCPGCSSQARPGEPYCNACGFWLAGPQAAELWWIEGELKRVETARAWLVNRRMALLTELARLAAAEPHPAARGGSDLAALAWPDPAAQAGPDPAAQAGPGMAAQAGPGMAAQAGPGIAAHDERLRDPRRPELSGRTAARLLLAAGALLVVIAVIAFTVANWSSIGALGRCAILLGVTAIVLVAPRPLARRGMKSTAESVAAIGIALTIADAYLVRHLVVGGRAGGLISAAASCAALAGLWAAYGLALRLRGPVLAALGLVQLPGLIVAEWLVRDLGGAKYPLAGPLALALVLTCGADSVLADWSSRHEHRAETLASSVIALAAWIIGVALASTEAGDLHARSSVLWLSGTFAAAALIGIAQLPRSTAHWIPGAPVAVVSGALLAIGLALPAAAALPSGLDAGAFAVTGAMVAAGALALARTTPRPGDEGQGDEGQGDEGQGVEEHGDERPGDEGHGDDRPGDDQPRLTRLGGRMLFVAGGAAAVLGLAGLAVLPAALAGLLPTHWHLPVWSAAAPLRLGSSTAISPGWPGSYVAPAVLALLSVACWLAPVSRRLPVRASAIAIAGLAMGSLPASAHLTGALALGVRTAAAVIMFGSAAALTDRLPVGSVPADEVPAVGERPDEMPAFEKRADEVPVAGERAERVLDFVAAGTGIVLAASATAWSLTGPTPAITELAVLTVVFCLAATLARNAATAALSALGAIVTATGLACAVPLASGWPARYAAFAVLAVAIIAVGAATLLRRAHPVQALVLDLGAGPVVLLSAVMAARQAGTFAVLAVTAALMASTAAWLRAGWRRVAAVGGATCAVLAALAAQWRSLALALFTPYGQLGHAWRGHALANMAAARSPGLPLAVVVLVGCLAAAVTAAGAWRGTSRGSLDAVAVALLLVTAPAGLAGGLGYWPTVGLLLVLALALTGWAAASRSLAPAGAALAAASLALAWALAAPAATLVVLGCLAVAYPVSAWRSRLAGVRIAAAALTVLSAAALAECAALAAGRPGWQSGLAVLTVAVGAQLLAAKLAGQERLALGLAVELAGWLATAAGTAQCLDRPGPASFAIAVLGLACVGVSARQDRRPTLWAGLALCEAAWCIWLLAAGVGAPEPYTVPAAVAVIAFCWHHSRGQPQAGSWSTSGPALVLLLLPSLIMVWQGQGWIRPLLLGIAAAAVTLAGARFRWQAPLLLGAVVTLLDAGRELAPAVRRLAEAMPSWVPIALIGALLLWTGATYEARLLNLGKLRRSLTAMR